MRHVLALAAVLIMFLCLMGSAHAVSEEAELIGMDDFTSSQPSASIDAYGALRADMVFDVRSLTDKLLSYVSDLSGNVIGSALQNGAEILAVTILSAICCVISDQKILPFAGAAAVALVCMKSASSCAAAGEDALEKLSDYSHVLLPCLSTAAAVGGAWTSAGAKYAAATLFIDFLITVGRDYAVPLLFGYAAAVMTAQITEHPFLLFVVSLFRQVMKWSLILFTMSFTFYLSVTGILSGTVDAAAAKAAKTVLSGMLPVVGNILADASGSILSGAQMLRNSVGLIGMFSILAVCVSPFMTLGVHYCVYQIAGSLSSSLGDKRIGSLIKGVGDVYGLLLGMVGSVSVMLFVSVISLMKAVTGV